MSLQRPPHEDHHMKTTHTHTNIEPVLQQLAGTDTQQKNELLLCYYYFKAGPEWCRASVCAASGCYSHLGLHFVVPSWMSGSLPSVDKAWYRLLSAHSVSTLRKESIRQSSQQRTLIFIFLSVGRRQPGLWKQAGISCLCWCGKWGPGNYSQSP